MKRGKRARVVTPSDEPGKRSVLSRLALVAGIAAVGLYLAHAILYWGQINDDAFITFRYSKFLALGRGPYFNVGEHVEGYSNPLLMIVMSAFLAVAGDEHVLAAAKAIGIASGAASLVFTQLMCRSWLRGVPALAASASTLAWLGAAIVATQAELALNSTTGLETTLFAAGIVSCLWLGQWADETNRWKGAGVALALLVIARPEGPAVCGLVLAARLFGGVFRDAAVRRRWLVDAGFVAGAVVALLAWRWSMYDGQLLPNTYYAKLGGMTGRSTPLAYVTGLVGRHLAWVGLLPAPVALVLASRNLRRAILPAACVAGFGVLAIFLTGPDWMPGYRLLVPYVPLWGALSTLGVCLVADRAGWRPPEAASAFLVVAIVGLLAWQQPARDKYFHDLVTRARGYRDGHAALADWLHERVRPGETVSLMDIGIVGFKDIDLNVLDLTGLTDRTIAHAPGGFLKKSFPPSYILDRRPAIVIVGYTGPEEIPTDRPVSLVAWTEIERRLVAEPAFNRMYVRPSAPDPGAGLLEQLAAHYGAARVFRHAYPGRSYFLVAYALNP